MVKEVFSGIGAWHWLEQIWIKKINKTFSSDTIRLQKQVGNEKKKAESSSPGWSDEDKHNAVGLPSRRELPGVNSAKLSKELIQDPLRRKGTTVNQGSVHPREGFHGSATGSQKPSLFDRREGIRIHIYTHFLNYTRY